MRHAVVLRPAPGADRTVAALVEAGLVATAFPLFAIRAVAWMPPIAPYDAVMLTSAQAVLHAGPKLAALGLPVLAVGSATAAAARAAGLSVVAIGDRDVAALLDTHASDYPRLLHLAARDRVDDPRVTAITVYAADPLPVAAKALAVMDGAVVLVHSPRAAHRLAALIGEHARDRARVRLAVLSAAVATAAGAGWDAVVVADRPADCAIISAAVRLAD